MSEHQFDIAYVVQNVQIKLVITECPQSVRNIWVFFRNVPVYSKDCIDILPNLELN